MSDVFESESNNISFNLIRNEIKRMYNKIKNNPQTMYLYVSLKLYRSSEQVYRDLLQATPQEKISIDDLINSFHEELVSIRNFGGDSSFYLLKLSVYAMGVSLEFNRNIQFKLTDDFLREE